MTIGESARTSRLITEGSAKNDVARMHAKAREALEKAEDFSTMELTLAQLAYLKDYCNRYCDSLSPRQKEFVAIVDELLTNAENAATQQPLSTPPSPVLPTIQPQLSNISAVSSATSLQVETSTAAPSKHMQDATVTPKGKKKGHCAIL
jgi:hypothetical protein